MINIQFELFSSVIKYIGKARYMGRSRFPSVRDNFAWGCALRTRRRFRFCPFESGVVEDAILDVVDRVFILPNIFTLPKLDVLGNGGDAQVQPPTHVTIRYFFSYNI